MGTTRTVERLIEAARKRGLPFSVNKINWARIGAPGFHVPSQPLGKTPGAPDHKISEAKFQEMVIDLAHDLGWRVAHFHTVRAARPDGSIYYITPAAADGVGFLDLELVRERVVKAELKVPPNTLTAEQAEWLAAYQHAQQEAYVWYPADWDQIVAILSHQGKPQPEYTCSHPSSSPSHPESSQPSSSSS